MTKETMGDVVVTQADRDAYAREVETFGDKEYADRIRSGQRDSLSMLQAFARHRTEATRPLTAEIADLRAQLDEAMEALGSVVNSCTLRSLRGHDHVPSMREQQDALRAARAILAKRKQP